MQEKEAKLLIQEEVILALYRMFYGKQYDCSSVVNEGQINRVHVNAQKAIFFFSELMIPAGDYGFCWNFYGPYSERLQARLKILDSKKKRISSFYEVFEENTHDGLTKLFSRGQTSKIERASSIAKEVTERDTGGELLCSLLYISESVLPDRSFDAVNRELQNRKDYFKNEQINKTAWEVLEKLGLVSAVL